MQDSLLFSTIPFKNSPICFASLNDPWILFTSSMNNNLGPNLSIKFYKAICITKEIIGPLESANPGKSIKIKLSFWS